jgi:hypothetical protein
MTHRPYTAQFIAQCLAQATEEGNRMTNFDAVAKQMQLRRLEGFRADLLGDAQRIKAERGTNDPIATRNALALERAVRYIEGAIGYLK